MEIREHFKKHFRKYLKAAHLVFASLWGGGAVSLLVILCMFHPTTAHEMYIQSRITFYVEFFVVGPAAGGCLATGFLYAKYTPWGFFRFTWIIWKWVVNLFFIVFGLLWFFPRVEQTMKLAESLQHETAISSKVFFSVNEHMLIHTAIILLFVFVMYLSTFKPWGKRGEKALYS